jgi:UDP-3-O-[3-hydroxymyristoyl] N-acetylglucosamine deacetylase
MDGLPGNLRDLSLGLPQRTLKAAIGCVGVGLHSGRRVSLRLHPAAPDTGVVFRRTDLGIDIPARFDCVTDTRLCTLLSAPGAPHVRVGTVEHLMAALIACGIDNVLIEVNGPEIPVLDGSASPFVFLIDCAGIAEQAESRRVIEVLRTVRVEDGESFAELRPAPSGGFEMAVSIAFTAPAIGRQAFSLRMDEAAFRQNLAPARTFAMSADIAGLQAAGLARGGNLGNAVIVDGARVLNPGGLRMTDEFVRHKMLDVVGDLALAGAPLRARVVAHRPGHSLNNRLLRALFADHTAWAWADAPLLAGWASAPMAAASA